MPLLQRSNLITRKQLNALSGGKKDKYGNKYQNPLGLGTPFNFFGGSCLALKGNQIHHICIKEAKNLPLPEETDQPYFLYRIQKPKLPKDICVLLEKKERWTLMDHPRVPLFWEPSNPKHKNYPESGTGVCYVGHWNIKDVEEGDFFIKDADRCAKITLVFDEFDTGTAGLINYCSNKTCLEIADIENFQVVFTTGKQPKPEEIIESPLESSSRLESNKNAKHSTASAPQQSDNETQDMQHENTAEENVSTPNEEVTCTMIKRHPRSVQPPLLTRMGRPQWSFVDDIQEDDGLLPNRQVLAVARAPKRKAATRNVNYCDESESEGDANGSCNNIMPPRKKSNHGSRRGLPHLSVDEESDSKPRAEPRRKSREEAQQPTVTIIKKEQTDDDDDDDDESVVILETKAPTSRRLYFQVVFQDHPHLRQAFWLEKKKKLTLADVRNEIKKKVLASLELENYDSFQFSLCGFAIQQDHEKSCLFNASECRADGSLDDPFQVCIKPGAS